MFSSFFVNSACHYCDALITHLAPFEGVLRFVDHAKCDVYKKKNEKMFKDKPKHSGCTPFTMFIYTHKFTMSIIWFWFEKD